MKYISICSGIEAASAAWHGLVWTPLAFSEIEPFPSAVLAHHYPEVPNLGDMSKFREWPEELLAECELLVGGTPCQAFSVAGLRKSLDDARGNLSLIYVQMFHHINEIRRKHGRSPAIALWENVPGVLSTKDNAFGCFISGLLGVDDTLETQDGKWPKAGFLGSETVRVGYRVLDAQYFAVAQRRRRVFLVAVPCELIASLGERACPSEILSLRESVLGNPPTRGEAWQAVAGGVAERAASGGNGFCQDDVAIDKPYPTIDAQIDRKWGSNQWVNNGFAIIERSSMAVRTAQTSANGHGVAEEVAHTLDQVQGQAVATPIDLRQAARGEKVTNNRSSGSGGPPGSGVGVPGDPAFTVSERGQAVAFPINSDADRKNSEAMTPSPDAEGRIRLRNPGIGIGDDGDPMFTVQATKPHAVAFKPGQSEAAGGTFVTEEFAPTIQSQNNGSTAVPAVAFKPSHFTRGKDGKPDEIAPPLSADADKGDQDTVIMRQSIGFNWQNGGGYGNANDGLGITEEGTGPLSRSQVPACVTGQRTHALTTRAAAVEEDGTGRGTPIVPVAFSAKDSGSDATEELSPTMRAMQHVDGNANAGGQIAVAYGVDTYNQTVSDVSIPLRVGNAKDSLPAAMVPFTKAKRAQSVNDDESWVPGEVAPTQNQFDVGDTRATTVVAFTTEQTPKFKHDCALTMTKQSPSGGGQPQCVAFTQNCRDEVRPINGDGQIAGALSAGGGMHQTNYLAFSPLQGGRSMPVTPESPTLEAGTGNKAPAVLAFANRTRDGVKVPEVMKDGVTPALTNPGNGGRSDAVNVCAFAQNQLGEVRTNAEVMGTVNTNQNASGRNTPMVRQAMQVRRLTPTECCRLQGFPDEHCDITFRKKPAADGPKYRALGNSMAVPCMAWLGYRIHLATRQDSTEAT